MYIRRTRNSGDGARGEAGPPEEDATQKRIADSAPKDLVIDDSPPIVAIGPCKTARAADARRERRKNSVVKKSETPGNLEPGVSTSDPGLNGYGTVSTDQTRVVRTEG